MYTMQQEQAKAKLRAALLNFYVAFDLYDAPPFGKFKLEACVFFDRDGEICTEFVTRHHLTENCFGGSL